MSLHNKENKDLINVIKKTCFKVNTYIQKGFTTLKNNNKTSLERQQLQQETKDFRHNLEIFNSIKITATSAIDTLIDSIYSIIKYNYGNCDEYALLTFFLLFNELSKSANNPEINLEIVELEGKDKNNNEGDHVFCLVNRDPKTNLANPNQYNTQTIIVDAWSTKEQYYHVLEHSKYLKNYKYINKGNHGLW